MLSKPSSTSQKKQTMTMPSSLLQTLQNDGVSETDGLESSIHSPASESASSESEPEYAKPKALVRRGEMSKSRLNTTSTYSASGGKARASGRQWLECPANPYRDKKCPATFKDHKSMRRHACRFHPVLRPHEPICSCAAVYRGQKHACLESGRAWYLADNVPDMRTVRANDPHWKPGKNYTPSQQLAPLPTWVSTITNFVHVGRASSAPPKWWFKDVCTRGLLNYMTTFI